MDEYQIADVLTPRQLHVLSLIAQGYSNVEISKRLYIERRTVERHIGEIMVRLMIPSDGTLSRRVFISKLFWIPKYWNEHYKRQTAFLKRHYAAVYESTISERLHPDAVLVV